MLALPDEMKAFARQWIEPQLQFSLILVIVLLNAATLLALVVGVSSHSLIIALATGVGAFFLFLTFLYIVYWGTERCAEDAARNVLF